MVRRTYSAEFKQQVVREALETGNNSLVARRHDLRDNIVSKWVRQYKANNGEMTPTKPKAAPMHVTANEHAQLVAESQELSYENEKLKKLLGEKDLEIAILRDLVKKTDPH